MTEKQSPEKVNQNSETQIYKIVLYNDDINTFDFVIDMLMKYCRHSFSQAEQCAMLTHYKGKSVVLKGEYKDMEPVASTLLDNGLSVEIE